MILDPESSNEKIQTFSPLGIPENIFQWITFSCDVVVEHEKVVDIKVILINLLIQTGLWACFEILSVLRNPIENFLSDFGISLA